MRTIWGRFGYYTRVLSNKQYVIFLLLTLTDFWPLNFIFTITGRAYHIAMFPSKVGGYGVVQFNNNLIRFWSTFVRETWDHYIRHKRMIGEGIYHKSYLRRHSDGVRVMINVFDVNEYDSRASNSFFNLSLCF